MQKGPAKDSLKQALVMILITLPFLFQNCQKPFNSSLTRSPSSNEDSDVSLGRLPSTTGEDIELLDPVQAAVEPFREGKFQVEKIGGQQIALLRQKMGAEPSLPAGERLIVLIDNHCFDESPQPLSLSVVNPARRLPLQFQSYTWILPETRSLTEIQALAEQDSCVIGLSHDDVARAGQVHFLNDSNLKSQMHFTAIGGEETFAFFNDPLRGSRNNVVVAVIDSGVNYNHPDLKNMLWKDGTGAYGYNFRSSSTFVLDDFGHGTAVAGLLAAEANNGIGVAGVMGHNIKVMSLKVQNASGDAYISDIVSAIDYARSQAVDVINISMEGQNHNASLQSALQSAVAANIFIAVAAGNGGALLTPDYYIVPASYGSSINGVMTVGSIDAYTGARSSFSNYGTSSVEIAAPGSNGLLFPDKNGGYSSGQGTSYACPLVAGAGALVVSFFKKNGITYNAALVESTLATAAVKRSNLNTHFTQGRVLDLRALALHLKRTYLSPVDGGFDED